MYEVYQNSVNNRNFVQNRIFSQKLKFWLQNEFFYRKSNFWPKIKYFVKNRNLDLDNNSAPTITNFAFFAITTSFDTNSHLLCTNFFHTNFAKSANKNKNIF